MHRLEENIKALDVNLTARDLADVEAVFQTDKVAGARYNDAGLRVSSMRSLVGCSSRPVSQAQHVCRRPCMAGNNDAGGSVPEQTRRAW